MVVYCVDVWVKPGKEEAFKEASRENHGATRKEPGNIRFDVLQSAEEPGRFFLYEVYESQEAVKAHKQTEHYLRWRETVADWMAQPRQGRQFLPQVPADRGEW